MDDVLLMSHDVFEFLAIFCRISELETWLSDRMKLEESLKRDKEVNKSYAIVILVCTQCWVGGLSPALVHKVICESVPTVDNFS